ncbi:LytR/AlgR family response regulator transcription factor [Aestuariivivens insulae]|uniref:LytR/AlgR family response regulator transcription factor n=1 Tax=Aestuariivivens insulae TaxID=1621988 RepID=UPI001F5A6BFB|nr:LytTR family DNA-binding domain-containing protein [Aestuariivivens insulae]
MPFNINLWENDEGIIQFIRLSKFSAIGISALAFSQFVLRTLFKVASFKLVGFIAWVLLEITLMALLLSLIYQNDGDVFWPLFIECLTYASLVIIIPYAMALLIIYVIQSRQKRNTKMALLSETDLIGIPDENNVIKLSIPLGSLLYFESADNYVVVQYVDDTKIKKKLIRNTLKNLERSLNDAVVKRCHRSYIVNLKSIKLIEKVSGKFFIHIKNSEVLIPISANYIPQFKAHIA